MVRKDYKKVFNVFTDLPSPIHILKSQMMILKLRVMQSQMPRATLRLSEASKISNMENDLVCCINKL